MDSVEEEVVAVSRPETEEARPLIILRGLQPEQVLREPRAGLEVPDIVQFPKLKLARCVTGTIDTEIKLSSA